ncbi:hypothetical protein PQ478_08690 [Alkalihalophilus pseudofirmus]|uniref:hypothetical protein n=1 Tax=Alkalihalophilus pseudofirmus TaxID=79885 RepID=UPI00259B1B74|nr:hypothetical protein [Alkalihalophilus pseudofirmus]WEG18546.1 hypothetical protein PQ478_08690 [Alkalihalophilus pseudofirmus]
MKTIKELNQGECIVVAETPCGTLKEYKGSFNQAKQIVFMCVPQEYKILGYIQN